MTPTSSEGLRFDIVADPARFISAATEVRNTWRGATEDMQKAGGDFGSRMSAVALKLGNDFGILGQKIDTGLTSKLEGFKGVAEGAAGLFGNFGVTALARLNPLIGALSTGISVFESFGGSIQAVSDKLGISDQFQKVESTVKDLGDAVGKGLTGDLKSMGDAFDVASVKLQNFLGLTGALSRNINGLSKSEAPTLEESLSAVTEKLDAARAQLDKLNTPGGDGELLGNFGVQMQARLKKDIAALEAVRDQIDMLLAQKIELPTLEALNVLPDLKTFDKVWSLQDKGGIFGGDKKKPAREGVDTFAQITAQLERQIELEQIKGVEFGKTAGEIAEQRAMLDATTRLQMRGITLTDAQADRLQDLAIAYGDVVDQMQRQREAMQELAQVGQAVSHSLESSFSNFIRGNEVNWRDMIKNMLADIAMLSVRSSILQPLFGGGSIAGGGLLGSLLGGLGGGTPGTIADSGGWSTSFASAGIFAGLTGRAGGGPVTSGKPYMVGEQGPELFVPQGSGSILPNHSMRGGGEVSVHYAIDARGAEVGVETRITAALAAIRPGIVAEAVAKVQATKMQRPGYIG